MRQSGTQGTVEVAPRHHGLCPHTAHCPSTFSTQQSSRWARSPNSRRPTRTSPPEARISRDRQRRRKIKSLAFVANGWSCSARKQGYAALALGSSEPSLTVVAGWSELVVCRHTGPSLRMQIFRLAGANSVGSGRKCGQRDQLPFATQDISLRQPIRDNDCICALATSTVLDRRVRR
jgi:hypothetical protein